MPRLYLLQHQSLALNCHYPLVDSLPVVYTILLLQRQYYPILGYFTLEFDQFSKLEQLQELVRALVFIKLFLENSLFSDFIPYNFSQPEQSLLEYLLEQLPELLLELEESFLWEMVLALVL
jgi:hypothetical protein